MKPSTIVYVSNTGHTRQYAALLGEKIGLPAYSLEEACSQLPGGSRIIYMDGFMRVMSKAIPVLQQPNLH